MAEAAVLSEEFEPLVVATVVVGVVVAGGEYLTTSVVCWGWGTAVTGCGATGWGGGGGGCWAAVCGVCGTGAGGGGAAGVGVVVTVPLSPDSSLELHFLRLSSDEPQDFLSPSSAGVPHEVGWLTGVFTIVAIFYSTPQM